MWEKSTISTERRPKKVTVKDLQPSLPSSLDNLSKGIAARAREVASILFDHAAAEGRRRRIAEICIHTPYTHSFHGRMCAQHAPPHANVSGFTILISVPAHLAHGDTWPPAAPLGKLRVVGCLQIITACFPSRSKAISCLLTPH